MPVKKPVIKFIEWLAVSIAIIIVLLAVVFSVARVFIPHAPKYQARIEQWATQTLKQPVRIGQMQASWHGFSPEVKLQNVMVLNTAGTRTLMQVKELDLDISLFDSLFKWRIEPSRIVISGTKLFIRQRADGTITVNGLGMPTADTNSDQNFRETINWLFNQNQVSMEKVNVTWYGRNGLVLPIKRLKLKLTNSFLNNQLAGAGILEQSTPMPFRFVLNLTGDIFAKDFNAALYVKVKNASFKPWLQDQTYAGLTVIDGQANAELWANWTHGQLNDLQTKFQAKNINLNSTAMSRNLLLDTLAGNVFWQRETTGWSLAGDHMQLQMNQRIWPENKFSLRVTSPQGSLTGNQIFQIKYLSVPEIKNVLLTITALPKDIQTMLLQLNPSGELRDLTVTHNNDNKKGFDLKQFSFTTIFTDLSWSHWQKLPGVAHLSGVMQWAPTNGKLVLKAKKVILDFGNLFRRTIPLNTLSASAEWQKASEGWQIHIAELLAQNALISTHSSAHILVPNNNVNPVLNIITGFNIANPAHVMQFLPVGILSKNLVAWLDQAIVTGKGASGDMVFNGAVHDFPFKHNEGRFLINSAINDLTLHYQKNWPVIQHFSGELTFDDNSMSAHADTGEILGAKISNTDAVITSFSNPILEVTGTAKGDMQNGLLFLQQSPLYDPIGKALTGIVMNGPMAVDLHLTVPLGKNAQPVKVQGKVALQKGTMKIPAWWNIHAEKLQGNLQFTENSIAGNIQGQLLDQPLNAKLSTIFAAQGNTIQIDLGKGQASLEQIQQWFALPKVGFLDGKINYQALLQFQAGENPQNTLTISSNLQGLAVNLPAPLAKSAAEIVPSQMQINFSDIKPLQLTLNYGDRASAALTYRKQLSNYKLYAGDIHLGAGSAAFQLQPGLLIDGELPNFVWADWKPVLASMLPTNQNSSAPSLLRKIDLTIGKISLWGMELNHTNFQLQPQAQNWKVLINGATVAGQLIVPNNFPKGELSGNLQRLYIPSGVGTQVESLTVAEIPALNLVCEDFHYGDKSIGRIELETSPRVDGMRINRLNIHSDDFGLDAAGQWQQNKSEQKSSLEGQLNTQDLGAVLKQWNVTTNLVGGHGDGTFDLTWLGAPYQPSLKSLSGNVGLHFDNGRIIHLSKSAEAELGIGRLLNLFSLETLPRRLRLDFSDLTDSGFTFDTMRGSFKLENGNAFTKEAYLKGPVAKVAIQGRIGLAAQDYDLQLKVTPYVTSGIPVVATIAGGPIAGAIAWVAEKIFSPAVSHIATYVYKVTGPWSNPTTVNLSVPQMPKNPGTQPNNGQSGSSAPQAAPAKP